MAFISLTARILQVLCMLTSLALTASCIVAYLDSPSDIAAYSDSPVNASFTFLQGLFLGLFSTVWYGMLLAVSFSRVSGPQHLGGVIILSIDVLINQNLFITGNIVATYISGVLAAKGSRTAALVLASIYCVLVVAEIGFDVVRILQALKQRSFISSCSNHPEISEFEQPGV